MKKCNEVDCVAHATLKSTGERKYYRCDEHRLPGMVNVGDKALNWCKADLCGKIGKTIVACDDKSRNFCSQHANDMVLQREATRQQALDEQELGPSEEAVETP